MRIKRSGSASGASAIASSLHIPEARRRRSIASVRSARSGCPRPVSCRAKSGLVTNPVAFTARCAASRASFVPCGCMLATLFFARAARASLGLEDVLVPALRELREHRFLGELAESLDRNRRALELVRRFLQLAEVRVAARETDERFLLVRV